MKLPLPLLFCLLACACAQNKPTAPTGEHKDTATAGQRLAIIEDKLAIKEVVDWH